MSQKLLAPVQGMHCAGCVNAVERAIKSIEGVQRCEVNLATEKASVVYDPGVTDPEAISKAVQSAGYDLVLESTPAENQLEQRRAKEKEKLQTAWKKVVWSWAVTLPLMIWMLVDMVWGSEGGHSMTGEIMMTAGFQVCGQFISEYGCAYSTWNGRFFINRFDGTRRNARISFLCDAEFLGDCRYDYGLSFNRPIYRNQIKGAGFGCHH